MDSFDRLVHQFEENITSKLDQSGFDVGISEDLQRTEQWFEQRKGRFTGSKIQDLMGCGRSTSKKPWGSPEKLIDFNETAKKYIFSRAKERQRNKVVKSSSSATMRYGTENESVVLDLLKKQFPKYQFKEVGFIEFLKEIAGASPDGEIITDLSENLALEIKCATDWNGLYERHEIVIDEKSKDWWQLQSEMLSLNVKKLMYVTAEPSENMFEPNITDLSIKYVDASPIHQRAIIQRCEIANNAINMFLKGMNFHEAIQKACTNYELNINEQYEQPKENYDDVPF